MTSVQGPLSLEFECLYKNLKDPLGLDTFDEVVIAYRNGEYDTNMNLSLETTEFYGNSLDLTFVMPPVTAWLQMIIRSHFNQTLLPILATLGYKQCAFVDAQNIFGRGTNAVINWAAGDHSQALLLSESLLGYLERYLSRLETNFFSI